MKALLKKSKELATGLLLIPLGFLLLFTFGELFSGSIDGLSHLLQMLPIAVLLFLVWKKPLIAGVLLVAFSLIFGIWYMFQDGCQIFNFFYLVSKFAYLWDFGKLQHLA